MELKNVLSLFDGISCGQIALNKANIKYNKYYSSEIDKSAIFVTKNNFPNTIFLGDINNYKNWDLKDIDLIMGGSPCQDLSTAFSRNKGIYGSKSILFFKFVECLNYFKPKYFLFENVYSMSKKNKDLITSYLKVEPIMIDSSLFTAQTRKRLYWTNIPLFHDIIDKHIVLHDILDDHVWRPLGKWCFNYYGKTQRLKLMTNYYDGKMKTLTTKNIHSSMYIRKDELMTTLNPNEYEKLQTLPINYTRGLSNTERFKVIGNGWTVDVIVYILEHLKEIQI